MRESPRTLGDRRSGVGRAVEAVPAGRLRAFGEGESGILRGICQYKARPI